MTGLMLRVEWPIENPDEFGELSVTAARAELPTIAEELQVTLVGAPTFNTIRGRLVCEAPAFRRVAEAEIDPLIRQLKDRRHRRGLKPYVVAELAGLSPQALYTAEEGTRNPTLSTLRAWADALGCDLKLVPRSSRTAAV